MDKTKIKELRLIAQDLRITGLRMVQNAHSGHIGGAFSLSEIMAVLYFEKMNVQPNEPKWEDRDRLVMSKGHATLALYPALAMRGFFPVKELDTFRHIDGHLSGHAEMNRVPGVDMSTGSLGQGFSAAVGIAVAGKQLKKNYTVYAILGDGEIQEGQIWEGCMYAGGHNLDNLIAILDNNKVQLDGTVAEVLNTGDLTAKFASFGFEVIPVDGHDVEALCGVINKAKTIKGKPVIIIANTIKGKGVSFMEGKSQWHGKTPDEKQFAEAFEELASARKEMEG
jgi:transketolase